MVHSLRSNTTSEDAFKISEEFDSLQRTILETLLGTVLPNESWHQAYLPINKTETRVRRAFDQIKAANTGSVSQPATLVEVITSQNPTADHTFTKMIYALKGVSKSQLKAKYRQSSTKSLSNNLKPNIQKWKNTVYCQSLRLNQEPGYRPLPHRLSASICQTNVVQL